MVTVPRNEAEMVDLERLRTELENDRTRLVAMTAACNVTGWLLPIRDVLELSQHANVPVLLDGAQVAGDSVAGVGRLDWMPREKRKKAGGKLISVDAPKLLFIRICWPIDRLTLCH